MMGKKNKQPKQLSSLYVDPESGSTITTQSMLKTFRRCPKQAEYKYYRRLKPKSIGRPLTFGKWMHSLYEAYYKGEDWELVHAKLSSDFSKLFDEEKDKLGDLPRDCARLMRAYIWHYKAHSWDVLGVEEMLEAKLPNGSLLRIKYDMLVEDEFGTWLVDHKNFKTFPSFDDRLRDAQSSLYLWAARQMGIPAQGFIWNYVRSKPMTIPTPILNGSRLSLTTMRNCDFPTALQAVKDAGLDQKNYRDWLLSLKGQRYDPNKPQTSEFFQRYTLEKDDEMLDRVIKEYYHSSLRMHDYDFSNPDTVERIVDRSCNFMCSFKSLCQTELVGGNTELMLRKDFGLEDPMAYYYDEVQRDDRDDSTN